MGVALALVALQANDGDADRAIAWLHSTWRTRPDAAERLARTAAEDLLRAF
jgi:translation elongation factor EF-Ts